MEVISEVHVSCGVDRVWNALTRVDEMVQWFFPQIPEFKAEQGFTTCFTVYSNERKFVHQWTVRRAIPHKQLILRWQYPEFTGDSAVSFTLFESEGRVCVRVVHEGVLSFPQEVEEFHPESCKKGWDYFLAELSSYLR